MKRIGFGAIGLALAVSANAEVFTIDAAHAEIGFSVRHLMLTNTRGRFNSFDGTLDYDTDTRTLKSAKGWIEAASIDTGNAARDKHLRNEDFFHVEKYPRLAFESTSVRKTGENTFEVTGLFNVLGVDRKVVLPVAINGPVEDPWGKTRIGIEGSAVLNRRDLGITHSPAAVIGDEVSINIQVEAVRP